MTQQATTLSRFATQPAALLTSFRRDGTPVPTVVSIVVEDDHAFVRTYERSGKFKRIRRNPEVEIRPATMGGKPLGDPIRAQVRVLAGPEDARAAELLAKKHPVLHGVLVPLAHRVRRDRTVHMELIPMSATAPGATAAPGT